jgi:hypothetical protein
VGNRNTEDWTDLTDDDYSLLGSRFARALKTQEKRRELGTYRESDWNHRPRKRIRPEPYRDRFI